jgi:hypothetical protein
MTDSTNRTITLTARQLRNALDFVAPDFDKDADQRETELSIAWGEAGCAQDDEGNPDPAGYRCWLTDYPEEGSIPLLDEYEVAAPEVAAPEAAAPVATVHGVGWELDDAEVRVFGVPVRTWRRSFACTEPDLEARALADKINAAAKPAPTDSQAGRDAVEARSQQFAERVRDGIADFAADNWPDRKHSLAEIENGIRAMSSSPPTAPPCPPLRGGPSSERRRTSHRCRVRCRPLHRIRPRAHFQCG